MSPIDPAFLQRLEKRGVIEHLHAVAVHGFPLDWNHWALNDWPEKLAEIQAATSLPVWVSEVGISTFGAEEVQVFGLQRTAELLRGRAPRVHWYSLYDLPKAWPATTRHREAEGSSYYRHFYMGLLREDGTPKLALSSFDQFTPELGICQWFHFEDHRLEEAVAWLRRLGVRHLRTGLSWADSFRPHAEAGLTGKWRRWRSSTSQSLSASPRSTAGWRLTTPARRWRSASMPTSARAWCAAMLRPPQSMTTFLLLRHASYEGVGCFLGGRTPGHHLNEQGRREASRWPVGWSGSRWRRCTAARWNGPEKPPRLWLGGLACQCKSAPRWRRSTSEPGPGVLFRSSIRCRPGRHGTRHARRPGPRAAKAWPRSRRG